MTRAVIDIVNHNRACLVGAVIKKDIYPNMIRNRIKIEDKGVNT